MRSKDIGNTDNANINNSLPSPTPQDKIRHDFKCNLRKVRLIYEFLEENIKAGGIPASNYIEDMDNTLSALKNNWTQLKSKW